MKLNPNDPRVIELQFNYAIHDKDWTKAASFLDPLAKLNRDRADGMLFHVRHDMARGALDDAASQATDLTKKLPEFSQSYLVLAQVQQAQHKYNERFHNFDGSCSQKQPDNFEARLGLIAPGLCLEPPQCRARANIDQGIANIPG